MTDATLPAVTIIIEWENAIDIEDHWARAAMSALQGELERTSGQAPAKPSVVYLYDQDAVSASVIQKVIDDVAPRLGELADLELVPTPGLTYYKLKNFGVARAKTDIVVMLDSDAGPQPGWLSNILRPFEDREVMAVGGFTVLGHEDVLSKTMALSWTFDLPSERKKTVARNKIHANNCAVRTDFFRANPFPDLPIFKKQCAFWLRDLNARGVKWVRTADAVTIHAPHPGLKFIVWRGWTSGLDRDYVGFQTKAHGRVGRLGDAAKQFVSKLARSWSRIWTKGDEVGLSLWEKPGAMLYALVYFSAIFAGQAFSALTRSFAPISEGARGGGLIAQGRA